MEVLTFNKEESEALYRIFCGLSRSCYEGAEVYDEAKPSMRIAYEKVLDWGRRNCNDIVGESLHTSETHAGLHPIFKNILDSQFALNSHNTTNCCSNCKKCTVHENENRKPSNKYYCGDTDDFIEDIEQHCCDNFEREQ